MQTTVFYGNGVNLLSKNGKSWDSILRTQRVCPAVSLSRCVLSRFNISNYTDTDEKELAYFPATLPSDNGSAGTTETSCGDLD